MILIPTFQETPLFSFPFMCNGLTVGCQRVMVTRQCNGSGYINSTNTSVAIVIRHCGNNSDNKQCAHTLKWRGGEYLVSAVRHRQTIQQ